MRDKCSYCIIGNPLDEYDGQKVCKPCSEKFFASPTYTRFQKRYEQALIEYGRVKTYSSAYKGRPKIDKTKPVQRLETGWFRGRGEIDKTLQITAFILGYDVVYDIYINKDSRTDDNYHYSVYKGVGLAARSLK